MELDKLNIEFKDIIFILLLAFYGYYLYFRHQKMVLVEVVVIYYKRNRRRNKRQNSTTVLWFINEITEEKLPPNKDESIQNVVTSYHCDSISRSKETDMTVKTSSMLNETDQETEMNDFCSVEKVKSQEKEKRIEGDKSVHLVTTFDQNFVPCPAHFFHACLYGHKEIVRQLLANHRHKLDIQLVEPVTGYTAFHLACDRGHLSVVQQLMTFFGNECCRQLLTSKGKSGLILGAELGRIEIIKALLDTYKKKEFRYISFNKKHKTFISKVKAT